jgi:methionyl-tRNA formyltransferase
VAPSFFSYGGSSIGQKASNPLGSLAAGRLREYSADVRTVFFGTPDIAIPTLRALASTTELIGVVCQPDRPAGRGLEISEPAVKRVARELGIEVHQPIKVKTGNLDEWLRERSPDVAVVLAYGRILPEAVLAAPKLGCVNLHASLLPLYRGAAPIQWALIRGETETGFSLMQMDAGLDTGPVYCQRKIPIFPEDDAGTLGGRLAELGALVIEEDLPRAVRGEFELVPQDSARATFAPPLTREHGRIDWKTDAGSVTNLVRGLSPRPGAFTTLTNRTLKILAARPGPTGAAVAPPGTVVRADKGGLWIAALPGTVELTRVQPEGNKSMSGRDLVNGRALRLGDILGT